MARFGGTIISEFATSCVTRMRFWKWDVREEIIFFYDRNTKRAFLSRNKWMQKNFHDARAWFPLHAAGNSLSEVLTFIEIVRLPICFYFSMMIQILQDSKCSQTPNKKEFTFDLELSLHMARLPTTQDSPYVFVDDKTHSRTFSPQWETHDSDRRPRGSRSSDTHAVWLQTATTCTCSFWPSWRVKLRQYTPSHFQFFLSFGTEKIPDQQMFCDKDKILEIVCTDHDAINLKFIQRRFHSHSAFYCNHHRSLVTSPKKHRQKLRWRTSWSLLSRYQTLYSRHRSRFLVKTNIQFLWLILFKNNAVFGRSNNIMTTT